MITVAIGGVLVETWPDTLDIDIEMTYTVDELSVEVLSDIRPSNEASVSVTETAEGHVFSGSVVNVVEVNKDIGIWKVTARDNTVQMDALLVVEEYTDQSASAIVMDLISKYAPSGFSGSEVAAGAPAIETVQFDHKRLSECFKWLCDFVGWQWWVDPEKVIHFVKAENVMGPAPMELTPDAGFFDFRLAINTENIRNKIYIKGGKMLSDAQNFPFVYDGVMRAWTPPYKPHELRIFVSEVEKTVGIENIHAATDYDFLMNFQEPRISMGTNYTSPPTGATIRQSMKYDIDVITLVEDLRSQAALAAITGGDGVREHIIEDSSLVTLQAAEAAGALELRKWADPEIDASFQTYVGGWQPGQLLRVYLPERGLDNTYMVQKVNKAYRDGQWVYAIRFGGRLVSVADFLQALVSTQRSQAQTGQTAILQKYIYVNETVTARDELITTVKTGPYICGDPDAICGEVVCLA